MQAVRIITGALICLISLINLADYLQGQIRAENAIHQIAIALIAIAQTIIPSIFLTGIYFFIYGLLKKD